jgi:hypothetical protein
VRSSMSRTWRRTSGGTETFWITSPLVNRDQ